MTLLTLGITIFNLHTRLTRLETGAPFLTALGAAIDCRARKGMPMPGNEKTTTRYLR